MDDEEGEGRGDEDEDEGGAGPDTELQGFTKRWNLLILVDEVSELSKYNWEQTFNMDVGEFMTWCCYGRDKAEYKAEQIKKWQREHNNGR